MARSVLVDAGFVGGAAYPTALQDKQPNQRRRYSGQVDPKALNPIILDEFVLQFRSSRPFGWTIPPSTQSVDTVRQIR